MPHCAVLGGIMSHDRVDSLLDLREHLWHRSRNINFGGSWRTASTHKVTGQIRENLHRSCDYFLEHADEIKISILQDTMYVYTNQYAMRNDLIDLGFSIEQITTVKLNRPIDTVKSFIKDSILRCYFKQAELTETEHEMLIKFLDNNREMIRPSKGLLYFLERPDRLLRNYYFIDFKDEKLISALELMTPNLIRKIMPVVK